MANHAVAFAEAGRALRSGRLARLGATRALQHGLLERPAERERYNRTMLAFLLIGALGVSQAPVPQPFPRPGSTAPAPAPPAPRSQAPASPSNPAPPPAAAPNGTDAPTESTLGVPVYPGAQYLASYDAGRGQRYYIFGSNAAFMDLVTYYRTALKQKGEMIFDAPATYGFEVGKYREETMAFPPGVTIKDYQTAVSEGYPNPKPGGQPARFRTILQFVPVAER